jgi:hypothetical protein
VSELLDRAGLWRGFFVGFGRFGVWFSRLEVCYGRFGVGFSRLRRHFSRFEAVFSRLRVRFGRFGTGLVISVK